MKSWKRWFRKTATWVAAGVFAVGVLLNLLFSPTKTAFLEYLLLLILAVGAYSTADMLEKDEPAWTNVLAVLIMMAIASAVVIF